MCYTDEIANKAQETLTSMEEAKQWFAMRVTFRRELSVKQLLDNEQIENYIAMRCEVRVVKGRRVRVMVPVIHNLIFVRSDRQRLQAFKASVPHLQYMTTVEGDKRVPIVVPDWQMENFIKVSSSDDSNLIYFDSVDNEMAAGTLVRIHGGAFDGLTGSFVKIKGKRNKRVVVTVQNVMAVAIDALSYDYMEIIK